MRHLFRNRLFRNRLLKNLLFSVVTAVVILGIAEGILRTIPYPDPGIYAGNPAGLWTLRPNLPLTQVAFREEEKTFTVRTNSRGYRGGEPVPGGILCLGDSTTFGWGVKEEEAWPAVLGRLLGWPVENGGVPGYSTFQGLATIEHALAAKPGLVILAYLVRDAEQTSVPDAERPWKPDLWLMRALRPRRTEVEAGAPAGPTFRVPPAVYRENLDRLVATVRATGAEVLVLPFPMVNPSLEHLDALAGLPVVKVRPHYDGPLFFTKDPLHLNASGHKLLAEEVAREILQARRR